MPSVYASKGSSHYVKIDQDMLEIWSISNSSGLGELKPPNTLQQVGGLRPPPQTPKGGRRTPRLSRRNLSRRQKHPPPFVPRTCSGKQNKIWICFRSFVRILVRDVFHWIRVAGTSHLPVSASVASVAVSFPGQDREVDRVGDKLHLQLFEPPGHPTLENFYFGSFLIHRHPSNWSEHVLKQTHL